MTLAEVDAELRSRVESDIWDLVSRLGDGQASGTAYDTAWGARLAGYYADDAFKQSVNWLRRHQYADGSWGGERTHYHDRFISTLAAIIALREVGDHPRDKRRVERGENALWKLIGRLGRDDSDTVGFPILAAALASEAKSLGLDVPRAPIRHAAAYKRKVDSLLQQPLRNWLTSPLAFSFEALRFAASPGDQVLERNHSVSLSYSATAAYLMIDSHPEALAYMRGGIEREGTGAVPFASPIDLFEVSWALNWLQLVGAVEPDHPRIRPLLDFLWANWSAEYGVGHSSKSKLPDIDDTAACFLMLHWGGYPVQPSVFDYYELDEHFSCYVGETNPSLSAHIRLLAALRKDEDHPENHARIRKAVSALTRLDDNGSFWWDKWHASPYYVTSLALRPLHGIADELAHSRFRWILRTQNDDGGWSYLGKSTAEETAYCLHALLYWDRNVERVQPTRITTAASFLLQHLDDPSDPPLWIAKSLYTPYFPVKAVKLGAIFDYISWSD